MTTPEKGPSGAVEALDTPCPVAYCRGRAGHRHLHDIPACTPDCGPLRPGLGREHAPTCPNRRTA